MVKHNFLLVGGVLLIALAGACNRDEFIVPIGNAPGADGGLGSPAMMMAGTPVPVGSSPVALAAGDSYSCARAGTRLGCWGNGLIVTALGGDSKLDRGGGIVTFGAFAPISSLSPTDLAADGERLCLIQAGQVLCTEPDDPAGTLDDTCRYLGGCGYRLRAVALPEQATAVDVAQDHACALGASGKVFCWGRNDRGQLGHAPGTAGDLPCSAGMGLCNPTPTAVAGVTGAVRVSVGSANGLGTSCALANVTLSCWGANDFGQLGQDVADSEPHPQPVAVLAQYRGVSVGPDGVCAVALNGGAFCWGNSRGDLNLPALAPREIGRLSEVTAGSQVPLNNIVQIDRGLNHACAVDTDGRVWCWGSNAQGELGRGRAVAFDSVCKVGRRARLCTRGASRVESLTDATAVAVGISHTCAARKDSSLWCWGNNSDGQIGQPVKEPEDAHNFTSATAVAGASF